MHIFRIIVSNHIRCNISAIYAIPIKKIRIKKIRINIVYASALAFLVSEITVTNSYAVPQTPHDSTYQVLQSENHATKRQDHRVHIGGGSGILIPNSPTSAMECTLTTIGYDDQHRIIGITAVHCGFPGSAVLAKNSATGGPIGQIITVNSQLDYAVILFDTASVAPEKTISGITIAHLETHPRAGTHTACKVGSVTGKSCGVVTIVNFQSQKGQICILPGDSGSPIVIDDTLIGLVNAYYVFGCLGPETGATIAAILKDIKLHFTPV